MSLARAVTTASRALGLRREVRGASLRLRRVGYPLSELAEITLRLASRIGDPTAEGRGFLPAGRSRIEIGKLDLAGGGAGGSVGRHDVHRHFEIALLRPGRARKREGKNRTDRILRESLHDIPPACRWIANSANPAGYMPDLPALSTSNFSRNVLLLPPCDRRATSSSFAVPRATSGSCSRFPPSRKSVCQLSSRRSP